MEKKSVNDLFNPVVAYFLTLTSKATVESYRFRLRSFCTFTFDQSDFDACDWRTLNYISVLQFIQFQLSRDRAHTTINVTLSALKSVALHAWQLEYISTDEYLRIKNIKNLKGTRLAAGRTLSIEEVSSLKGFFLSDDSPIKCRDYAMFALAAGAGLRRRELMLLDIEHINDERVIVHGKGNKVRTIFLTNFVRSAITRWFLIMNRATGPLFVRVLNSHITHRRIGVLSIHRTMERAVRLSGSARFTTHDLRRTFATTLLDVGADKFAVKQLMGHSSLSTTEIYDRRGDKAGKAAIELLPF